MKYLLPLIFFVSIFLFTACQEDDYEEIIGVCPVVLSTDPANLAINVPLDKIITVTFNTDLDPATINTSSIIVLGTDTLAGTVTLSGTTASFTPTFNLIPFTTYTGIVTTAVKDITGNALQQKYVWSFTTGEAGVNMGLVSGFGILASAGITSAGLSEVHNADIGVSPGLRSSITGFPQAVVIDGSIFAADDLFPVGTAAMLIEAHAALTNAYLFAQDATSPSVTTVSGDLGGRTLQPGIYRSVSATNIQSGNLTLDAQGDPNAFWIFQMPFDFVTQGGSGGNVILAGGAQAKNVFWQSAGTVTLGNNTSFMGNIMALNNVRLNPNATIEGRLFSRSGSVILANTNIILKP